MQIAKEVSSVTIGVAKQEMKQVLTITGNEVMFMKAGYGVKIAKVVRWKDEGLKI